MLKKMIRPARAVIFLWVAIASASPASAFESRFEIDPSLRGRLSALARDRVTNISSSRQGDLYIADASAVLRIDAGRMFAAAVDYDRYVQFGMPRLNASRVVDRPAPDLFYVYSEMSYATMRSSQHMEVRVHRKLGASGSAGIEWQLTPARAHWPAANPQFTRMDGSFYLEPLADGYVYVRYFLASRVDLPLSGLLSGLVQKSLRNGAADVITVLARQALLQQ